jgi:MFS family permease
MLSSITPLGERGRTSRWPVTATAYVLGSMLGGAGVGALAGGIGWLLPFELAAFSTTALVLLAVAAAVAVLIECRVLPSLPTVRRQVDEDWLHRYRGWVYGLGFGVQLGAGLVTIVTSPTIYLTTVLAAVTGTPLAGAVIGLVFGLTRALPVLGQRRVASPARLASSSQRLASLAPTGRAVAATGLGAVSVASAVQALVLAGGS